MPKRRATRVGAEQVSELLELQEGMITRAQLGLAGAAETEVRSMLAGRALHLWVPGVYSRDSGTLTWKARAWGAVLAHAPAALDRDSALRWVNGPGWRGRDDDLPIQIAVSATRGRLAAHSRIELRSIAHFDERVLTALTPMRVRTEEAVLDAAMVTDDELDRIEILARAVRARVTTADRLLESLAARRRAHHRHWLESVLVDVRDGTHSVLEHRYLTRVEQPHGLPRSSRQLAGERVYHDTSYGEQGLLVELDGRLDHLETKARARDLARDLDSARDGMRTVRLGWAQVGDECCATAGAIGELLRLGGWSGTPTPCGLDCTLRESA